MKITIDLKIDQLTRKLFCYLLGIEIFIVLCDIFLNYIKWLPRSMRKIFNMTREDGILNWFSNTQTLAIAIVALLMFLVLKELNNPKRRISWGIIAVFFTYMTIDDATKMHERVGISMRELAEGTPFETYLFSKFPSYSWQLIYGPFFAIMGTFVLWFLWKELKDRQYRRWPIYGILCFVIAVILDFVEGLDLKPLDPYEIRHNMKVVEEFIELLGQTIFLLTFVRHFLEHVQEICHRTVFRNAITS